MREITVGDIAYLDSFSGLVPCKITEVRDCAGGWPGSKVDTGERVTVKITGARPGYHVGDVVAVQANHVIPPSCVRRRGGVLSIVTDFKVVHQFYASTYCNCGHYVKTGRPYKHECKVIPPAALRLERDGDFDGAVALLNRAGFFASYGGM